MKKQNRTLVVFISLIFCISCGDPNSGMADLNPVEEFEESDSPVEYVHEDLSFQSPWGYEKPGNLERLYPILVSGMWGEGKEYYKQIAKDYPAFVIDYQNKSEADGQVLGEWIKSAVESGYRIDMNRIYLTGFSYGGSSSYPLARGMYTADMFFAAIIRVAGQSQSDLGNEIAQKTAVWYHIGLSDTEKRVEVARDALENMRNYACNLDAVETSSADSIAGYERLTINISRSGYSMFRYCEYTDMGHTPGPAYTDEELFPWLFTHSLEYR